MTRLYSLVVRYPAHLGGEAEVRTSERFADLVHEAVEVLKAYGRSDGFRVRGGPARPFREDVPTTERAVGVVAGWSAEAGLFLDELREDGFFPDELREDGLSLLLTSRVSSVEAARDPASMTDRARLDLVAFLMLPANHDLPARLDEWELGEFRSGGTGISEVYAEHWDADQELRWTPEGGWRRVSWPR